MALRVVVFGVVFTGVVGGSLWYLARRLAELEGER